MSEQILIPNQPYPTLPAWEDLSDLLANGWEIGETTGNNRDYLRGFLDPNTATVMGRLRIGTDRVATVSLPWSYRPDGTATSPSATVRGVGPAEVEIWRDGRVVLPHNSITQGSRAEHYEGELFVFTITYPRRAS